MKPFLKVALFFLALISLVSLTPVPVQSQSSLLPVELYGSATSSVATTTEADILAASTSYRFFITSIVVYNTSAADTVLNLYENGSGGTLLGVYPAPSKGGVAIAFPTPIPLSAKNKKLTIDEAATADSIYVTITYFKLP